MLSDRRRFLRTTSAAAISTLAVTGSMMGEVGGVEPWLVPSNQAAMAVEVELPRLRVPLAFIIDDSTCLVNMGKYCMPQFAATYPAREDYQRPWRSWPAEIPDSFVREFGQWCGEHGVKGKYSIVPYPACVGWLDRELPGWSQQDLQQSLKLVRELMVPNWDIHPEMITHTRVIDLASGRPFADYSPDHMENSYPSRDVSVDYLASYLAYALRILKNCELPCEGITTPGGFGNRVKEKLPQAVFEAVRDVFAAELPHYFKYVEEDDGVLPRLEARRQSAAGVPEFAINVPAGTGDWFGGWDGVETPEPDRYATADAEAGRMVDLINKRLPAIMLCHWPGMFCNGQLTGYRAFQRVVLALEHRFKDQTEWMKISSIGRYYAAKEVTEISVDGQTLELEAPYACPDFTLRLKGKVLQRAVLTTAAGESLEFKQVTTRPSLNTGCFVNDGEDGILCFDLPAGHSSIAL